jgi:tetratricopeptide (TPR) repeat protein
MTLTHRIFAYALCSMTLTAGVLAAQAPAPSDDVQKQVQEQLRNGQLDQALTIARTAADANPASLQATTQAGIVLDLQAKYNDARGYFEKAVAAAKTPEEKSRAFRNMAMSYAFARDCGGAVKYQQQAFDLMTTAKDVIGAAEAANEVARVCLESNGIAEAETWYRKGHDTALQAQDLTPAQKDLWEFRWEHAQARIAARRGQASAAAQHVEAAKAVLDKGTNPEQAPFLPYLTGYVAFYAGDYKAALAELEKANQNDPFILSLVAQAREKLGSAAQAQEIYRKILTFTAHNPANAYARPLAMEKMK